MRILFLSYYFGPQNSVAAIRTTKFIKYLHNMGYAFDVICGPAISVDPILANDVTKIPNINVIHGSRFFEKKIKGSTTKSPDGATSKKIGLVKKIIYKILPNAPSVYLDNYNSIIWFYNAKRIVSNKIKSQKYDVIISSYGPISSHLLGRYAKKKTKTLWIADYRDAMIQGHLKGFLRYLYEKEQHKLLKQSDLNFCVSAGLARHLSGLEPKSKIYVITNGFDLADSMAVRRSVQSSAKLIFSYCGTLYGGKRDITLFFSLLKELIDEKKIEKEALEFLYAGDDYPFLLDRAEEYGLVDILVNKGAVSRDQSMRITSNSDIALLLTWNTKKSQGIVTGKLYELFLLKKTILGFVSGSVMNSEVKLMIEQARAGVVYEQASPESYEVMKNTLLSLYRKKRVKESIVQPYNQDYIERFNYSIIVKEIDRIIRTMIIAPWL